MTNFIPAAELGAVLQSTYGCLGNYTYTRCHKLILDGRLATVRSGRGRFFDRAQLPEIAEIFGIAPTVSSEQN